MSVILYVSDNRTCTCYWQLTNHFSAKVKFSGSWDSTHLAWAPTTHLQAPTRPATAPLGPYVNVQIMIATILLSKCLTRMFLQSECKIKISVFSGFNMYYNEAF